MRIVDWDRFKKIKTLIDIRPAHEYAKSHIPGAVSLPFPIDLKRLKKAYPTATHSPEAHQILDYISDYKGYMESLKQKGLSLGLYCKTGGLRSLMLSKIMACPIASIRLSCSLGNQSVFMGSFRNIQFLEGGFNSYLNNFYGRFKRNLQFIKICGLTGSGKTEILQEINKQGGQVLDLEKLAHHSGSAFGGIGKKGQPHQWNFEQSLLHTLESFTPKSPVFVEEKGSGIGSVHIPSVLSNQFELAPKILIEVSKKRRIENLVYRYGKLPKRDLEIAITKIAPRLSSENVKKALKALKENHLGSCAALLLDYYDQSSVYSRQFEHKVKFTNTKESAKMLLDQFTNKRCLSLAKEQFVE